MLAALYGILSEIFEYESLSLKTFQLTLQHFPKKLNQFSISSNQQQPHYGIKYNGTLAKWDYPDLLGQPFTWILKNESVCHRENLNINRTNILLLLVTSSRSHFGERSVFRNTWGSSYDAGYNNWTIRLVFLLGQGNILKKTEGEINQEDKRLLGEHESYGDLIQGNFVDTYRNLSYKHLMGYKYVLNFCQQASLVIKVDDDVFIDIPKWVQWRTEDMLRGERAPVMYCYTYGGARPRRNPKSKWHVSVEEYSDDYYPDYCMGGAYAMTVNYINRIYASSNFAKFLWIEDAFVTGVLREAAKHIFGYDPIIRHLQDVSSMNAKVYQKFCDKNSNYVGGTREFKEIVLVPRGKTFERDMICLWRKVMSDRRYS